MLKIGDFSRLGQVTVKTLRHYAQLGLLKPAWIDRFTSYRYYTLDQLPRLNRILALKDLGFSLEQIASLLDDNLSAGQLQGIVMLKQAELEQRVQAEQVRLARVEARLKQIEQEGQMPLYEVVLRSQSELAAACTRAVVPELSQMDEGRRRLRRIISAWLEASGTKETGPWLALFESSEFVERDIALQFGCVLAGRSRLSSLGEVQVKKLPPVEHMACVVHGSSQHELYPALHAFYAWADFNGFRVCGPVREVYLEDERSSQAGTVLVEHQFPVEPVRPQRGQSLDRQTMENKMEPKIIHQPGFLVAGTLYQGKNENQEISAMWQHAFTPRMAEIKSVSRSTYGVCITPAGLPEGEFQYIAGMQVASEADVPEGMVITKVPAGEYAVFEHHGALEKLGQTYEYIYQSWLPASGYKVATPLDYELYDDKFNDFQEDSILYLYVPIVKK
jgi:predicted transcriptional regulator YdeE/DNA-binding transcriptional MerR regulator